MYLYVYAYAPYMQYFAYAKLMQSQEMYTYTPSSYLNMVVINVPSDNINTVPSKINLYIQWLSISML